MEYSEQQVGGAEYGDIKTRKKTAFPFFILHECGDGVRRVAEKVSRDVIGVTDTQTEVSVVEICAKGKKDTQHHSQAVFVATDGCGERAEKLLYEIPELKRVKGKKESYAFLIREMFWRRLKMRLLYTEVIGWEQFTDYFIFQNFLV